MIQKERTRLLKLIDEVAEIFQTSSLFLEQLDKVIRELQNLILCYKNIYFSKSQTSVQSCHQFLLKKSHHHPRLLQNQVLRSRLLKKTILSTFFVLTKH